MLQYNDEISERLGLTSFQLQAELLDFLNPDYCSINSKFDTELELRLNPKIPSKLDSNNNSNNIDCSSISSNSNSSANSDQSCGVSKKNGEKYSLRPRSARKRKVFLDECDGQDENFKQLTVSHGSAGKKNQNKSQRSRSTATQNRPKQKAAPLSKYRRKTANARERTRMREINMAFEALRKAVPQITPNHQQNEKLTKITTLRLAMKYISALSAALNSGPNPQLPQQDIFSECSELETFLLESDGESLPLRSDQSDRSMSDQDQALTPSADFPLDSLDFDDALSDFSSQLPFDPFLGDFS